MDKIASLVRIHIPIVVLTVATVLPAAAAPVAPLGVRVVNLAGVPPQVLSGVLATVTQTFAEIGIEVRWDADSGERPVHSQQLIVVLLPTDRSTTPNRWNKPGPLGSAIVDARVAYIYYDRVVTATGDRGMPQGPVLSWAIAHEIGHLLLPGRPHAERGVMREAINPQETLQPRFAAADAAAIRANLIQRRFAGESDSIGAEAHPPRDDRPDDRPVG